jgi:hypothetical protein
MGFEMVTNNVVQPCTGCGRETKVGTPLFSDRQTAHPEGGEPIYLCGDCNERAVSHFGRRLTEKDMLQLSARAAGIGVGVGVGGGFGGAG